MQKRSIASFIAMFSIFLCAEAFAGGAGDCVQPLRTTTKFLGVGGAFEYNYVNSRYNHLNNPQGPKDMSVKDVSQVYGKFSIGLFDYLNFYLKAGAENYNVEYTNRVDGLHYKLKLRDGIYAGMGLNGLFPVWKLEALPLTFGAGFDVQGNFSHNDIKSMERNREDVNLNKGTFYAVDGQNSLYLTCKFDVEKWHTAIVPYVGGYHSWIVAGSAENISYKPGASVPNVFVENKSIPPAYDVLSFGVLVGVDVDIAKYVNLNIEGRFVGETALTTGATIKF